MNTKLTNADKFKKPKLRHTTPCSECPWRRTHPAGWLGGYAPEEFVRQVHHDGPPLSCHKTDSMEPPSMCAGALIHMRNSCKSSRHPSYEDALKHVQPDTETVFERPSQFTEYHNDPDGWFKAIKKRTTI